MAEHLKVTGRSTAGRTFARSFVPHISEHLDHGEPAPCGAPVSCRRGQAWPSESAERRPKRSRLDPQVSRSMVADTRSDLPLRTLHRAPAHDPRSDRPRARRPGGARLTEVQAIGLGKDALLRLIQALPDPEVCTVRALGVDDFAPKKGQVYGMVQVDMERARVPSTSCPNAPQNRPLLRGCTNSDRPHRELRERGPAVGERTVRRFVHDPTTTTGPSPVRPSPRPERSPPWSRPTPTTAPRTTAPP